MRSIYTAQLYAKTTLNNIDYLVLSNVMLFKLFSIDLVAPACLQHGHLRQYPGAGFT